MTTRDFAWRLAVFVILCIAFAGFILISGGLKWTP